jgi:hypothetical protein
MLQKPLLDWSPAEFAASATGPVERALREKSHLTRDRGVRRGLEMIAGDTAGAITLLPEGERPEPVGGGCRVATLAVRSF